PEKIAELPIVVQDALAAGVRTAAQRRQNARVRCSWVATITRAPSPCGAPAEASAAARRSARTDGLGYRVGEDPGHRHDLHATILHLLGLDHTRLTFRYQGRDFRLTDVHGQVVQKLLA